LATGAAVLDEDSTLRFKSRGGLALTLSQAADSYLAVIVHVST
jgi:hypothetical protein